MSQRSEPQAGEPEQTALVVEVPAAEAVVGRWRVRYDRAARAGVPAHVTVCFPFLAPDDVDRPDVADALTQLAAHAQPFTTTLSTTGTFGTDVLWLAPEPAAPFRALTRAVFETFGVLPHGGAHGGVEDAVPHLTVAEHPDDLDEVRSDVERGLPITAAVTTLTLLQGTFENGWRVRGTFPLGQR